MSTLVRTDVAAMPRVNLLPPEIAEAQRFRRVQMGLGGAVVAAFAVVGVLYVGAMSDAGSAEEELEQTQAKSVALKGEERRYAAVPAVAKALEDADKRLAGAMGEEILWSNVMNDMGLTIPRRVWFTNFSATQTLTSGTKAAPATAAGPVLSTGIGQVKIEGIAYGHKDVATLLDALAKQEGHRDPYYTASDLDTESPLARPVVKFSVQTTLTDGLFSLRFREGRSAR